MNKKITEAAGHIRLGIFVLAGLLFLVLLLYMIGRNRNLFGSHLTLRAHFTNVDGLRPGHNVRYAGIEIGTVSDLHFMNDTTIEVTMTVARQVAGVLHKNAAVSIGTDGLVGNKVVNIIPAAGYAQLIKDGDLLTTKQKPNMDAMLHTLANTNNDVSEIAAELKAAILRINRSDAFWRLLNDNTIPLHIRGSARRIASLTMRADSISATLQLAVSDLKNGKGLLGTLLYDTSISREARETLAQFRKAGDGANALAAELTGTVRTINDEIIAGKGALNRLLKDTAVAGYISRSLSNIETGTRAFSQDMEALKHNFLFRGYFRKLEKQQEKQ